jgi:hypothetical protein
VIGDARSPRERLPASLHVLQQFTAGVVLAQPFETPIVCREKRIVDESTLHGSPQPLEGGRARRDALAKQSSYTTTPRSQRLQPLSYAQASGNGSPGAPES